MDTHDEHMDVQNTHDECTNCQNAYDEFMNSLNPHTTHSNDQSNERTSNMTMNNNQTTHETIHFKCNNSITWAKAILAKIQTRCDQLSGPQTGLVIAVNLYIAGTQASSSASNPAVLYPKKRNRLD